jgi:predicted nuclease with TOPRIM domain
MSNDYDNVISRLDKLEVSNKNIKEQLNILENENKYLKEKLYDLI